MDIDSMMVRQHETELRGNGRPGLISRTAVLEQRMDDMKENMDRIMRSLTWSTRFTLLTLIGFVVQIVIRLLKQ